MNIFITNIKRILRKRYNIIFAVIMPAIFIVLAMSQTFGNHMDSNIGVVDNDNTEYTRKMVESLDKSMGIHYLKDGEIKPSIIDSKFDYIIKIDKGFTQDIMSGKNVDIKGYDLNEAELSFTVRMYLNNYINVSKDIAAASDGDEKNFYKGMNKYNRGLISANYSDIEINTDKKSATSASIGFIIMSILFLATSIPSILMQDKMTKVYYRIFSTPIPNKKYMLMNILSFLCILSTQIIIILSLMRIIFHADFGASMFNMFVILFVFSIVSISLGICMAGLSKNFSQFWAMSTFINTPLLMLGGCYWPWDILPESMKKISYFLPTTWGLKAAQKILYSTSLINVQTEIGILLLFALVFFLLGSWKKRDISGV